MRNCIAKFRGAGIKNFKTENALFKQKLFYLYGKYIQFDEFKFEKI